MTCPGLAALVATRRFPRNRLAAVAEVAGAPAWNVMWSNVAEQPSPAGTEP